MVAVSSDPLLLNWEKLTGEAVIKPEDFLSCPRIFDPCIWKGIDYYYSLCGGVEPNKHGKREHRADFLFRSKDLVHWEFLHNFIDGDLFGHVGDDGACPYFWPIGDNKHILLHYSHMSGGAYMIGDYNRAADKFCVGNGGDFCFGRTGYGSVHAPSACPATDGSGDVICIFNMNAAKPTPPWNQIMSLPRRLSLYDGDRLAQVPAGNIESLREEQSSVAPMILEANKEIVLENIDGDCMEMEVEVDAMDANFIELKILRSPDSEEFTRIAFYKNRGYRSTLHRERCSRSDSIISLDNSNSSIAPDVRARLPENGGFDLPDGDPLKLRIFIDKSIVEVFANDRQCVALRVYPERDDSTGVSILAKGSEAKLLKLAAWQMGGVYTRERTNSGVRRWK
jgi:beta-fructofuranosidase